MRGLRLKTVLADVREVLWMFESQSNIPHPLCYIPLGSYRSCLVSFGLKRFIHDGLLVDE